MSSILQFFKCFSFGLDQALLSKKIPSMLKIIEIRQWIAFFSELGCFWVFIKWVLKFPGIPGNSRTDFGKFPFPGTKIFREIDHPISLCLAAFNFSENHNYKAMKISRFLPSWSDLNKLDICHRKRPYFLWIFTPENKVIFSRFLPMKKIWLKWIFVPENLLIFKRFLLQKLMRFSADF